MPYFHFYGTIKPSIIGSPAVQKKVRGIIQAMISIPDNRKDMKAALSNSGTIQFPEKMTSGP
jgi:hypothetical protein